MSHMLFKYFDVDFVIIILAFLFAFHGALGAGIFALGQGVLIDIFSAGLLGLFTFIYLIIFMGIRLGSRFFNLRTIKGLMIIISLAVILKNILFVSLLDLFYQEITFSSTFFTAAVSSAICSGIISPLFFYIFRNLNHVLIKTHGEPKNIESEGPLT